MGKLQRQQSVASAASKILLRQMQLFEANRKRWCGNQDPEALHDFRVAVRRSRVLLGQLKNDLPPATGYLEELTRFGAISGPLRDLDVLQQTLVDRQGFAARAPEDALMAVLKLLVSDREEFVSQLRPPLESDACRSFVDRWSSELRLWTNSCTGQGTLGEVADRQIDKNLHKLLDRGTDLSKGSADDDYHRLRIRGKKLRYLLEFFADLYPAELIPCLVKELKKLQEILGHFQDFSVWRGWLQHVQLNVLPEHYRQLDEWSAAQQQQWRNRFFKQFAGFTHSDACRKLQERLKA